MKETKLAKISIGAWAWPIAKGTLPIIGVTKVEHVDDVLKAMNISLSEDDIKDLEDLADSLNFDLVRMWEKKME